MVDILAKEQQSEVAKALKVCFEKGKNVKREENDAMNEDVTVK